MKIHLILLTLLSYTFAFPASLAATDFEVDGIAYNIINSDAKTVEVTSNQYSGDIIIPSKVEHSGSTYDVTEIGEKAFYNCFDMISVIIPNSINTIGQSAFRGCTGLTTVTIPNSVTQVGEFAFRDCRKLIKSAYPSSIGNPFNFYKEWYGETEFYGEAICYPKDEAIFDNGCIYGADKSSIIFVPLDAEGEFVIPNTVTTIGENAFYWCDGLTSVEIPNSVVSIGKKAFYRCGKLRTITIPNSVIEIGREAFSYTSTIKTAYPSGMDNPFYTIRPNGDKDEHDYSICYPREEAIFDNGCIYGQNKSSILFVPTDYTGEFDISDSATKIGWSAFVGCINLTSVNIPNSVTRIESCAFERCLNLTSVTIPESVTYIGAWAFYRCPQLSDIVFNAIRCTECGYIDGETYPAFPSSIRTVTFGDKVSEIPPLAFYKCNELRSITIPNSVTKIGREAFCKCEGLTSVIIPNSVTDIGLGVFSSCSGLTSVAISNSLTVIPMYTFYDCSKLKDITIPNSVTRIGDYAFYFSGLKSVIIPKSVVEVGKEAFGRLSASIKAAYPSDLENPFYDITYPFGEGKYVQYYWRAVSYPREEAIFENGCIYGPDKKSVIYAPLDIEGAFPISDSVTEIGRCAFAGCDKLTSVAINEGISIIGGDAFEGCSALSEVRFNAVNCTTCGDSNHPAFPPTIETLTFGSEVMTIPPYAFYYCTGLSSVTIPGKVTEIGRSAFKGCQALSEVRFNAVNCTTCGDSNHPAFPSTIETLTLGSEVTTIPSDAFRDCNKLSSITIPPTVNNIRAYAFKGCRGLKQIFSLSKVPPICSSYGVFTGVNKDECELKVPTGTIEAYRAAREWQDFLMIEETEYSSIAQVRIDKKNVNIYNLKGNCIRRNATQADIEALPAGIYIINNHKVIVKGI